MTDIQAALGTVQIRRLDEFLVQRDRVAGLYRDRLAGDTRLALQRIPDDCRISWFVFVVRLSDEYTRDERDAILARLQAQGIGCNVYFPPIHLQPFYQQELGYQAGDFPITEAVTARTMALPFHNHLSEGEVEQVVKALRSAL